DPSSVAQLDACEPLGVDSPVSGDTQPGNVFGESVKLQLHGMPSLTDYCSCGTGSLHTGKDQHHHRHLTSPMRYWRSVARQNVVYLSLTKSEEDRILDTVH